jgi:hypothetical protein
MRGDHCAASVQADMVSSSRGWEYQMTELSRFESRYDAFLFASLSEDDEIALSVLSVLARQDLDPWQEADRLTQLSKEQAINSLASKIWQSDSERWSPSESSILAIRLIELLPSHGGSHSSACAAEQPNGGMMVWVVVGMLLGSIAMSGNAVQKSAKGSSAPADNASIVVQQDASPQSPHEVATN